MTLRDRFRRRRPDEPRGARILHADGTTTECSIIRDPEDSEDGNSRWIIEPPPGVTPRAGDRGQLDYLPGHTAVTFILPRIDPP